MKTCDVCGRYFRPQHSSRRRCGTYCGRVALMKGEERQLIRQLEKFIGERNHRIMMERAKAIIPNSQLLDTYRRRISQLRKRIRSLRTKIERMIAKLPAAANASIPIQSPSPTDGITITYSDGQCQIDNAREGKAGRPKPDIGISSCA